MKKCKLLILCAVLTLSTVLATGCNRNKTQNNGTQAPYEDEVSSGAAGDLEKSGNNLKDAGRNLVDSVENAGSAIMDGVRGITGTDNTTNRNNTNQR